MTQRFARLQKQVRRQGFFSAIRTDFHEAILSGIEIFFRTELEPSLSELARSVVRQSVNSSEILGLVAKELSQTAAPSPNAPQTPEVGGLNSNSSSRLPYAYPDNFGMDREHLDLLGEIVRLTRPLRVVETGVADGFSSRAILQALDTNGAGQLTSFDVFEDVGSAVDSSLRERWELEILPKRGRKVFLSDRLSSICPIDIFLHDSDHSYGWQSFEYKIGFSALRPGGILISDDVDASYAFIDFVRRTRALALACVGSTKVMGIVVKAGCPSEARN